jgi:hypothetical protein
MRDAPWQTTAPDSWEKEDFARFTHRLKHAGSAHFTVDGNRDRRFHVTVFEQLLAEARKLSLKVFDDLADVAAFGRHSISPTGQFAKLGRNYNRCHDGEKGQTLRSGPCALRTLV